MANIKDLREKAFLTQRELAAKAGVTQNTVLRLEKGKNKPSLRTIRKIARALGVEPSAIEFS